MDGTSSSSTALQSTYVTLSLLSAKRRKCAFVAAMAGDSFEGCLYLSANDANTNLRAKSIFERCVQYASWFISAD